MFYKITKKFYYFLLLYFCHLLAKVQTKSWSICLENISILFIETNTRDYVVYFNGKEEAKKFFDEKICAEIITPFINGIKKGGEKEEKDACELLSSDGNIYRKLDIMTKGNAGLPTDKMFRNLYLQIRIR